MADLKKLIKDIFIYRGPHKEHDFTLPESVEKNIWEDPHVPKEEAAIQKTPLSSSLSKNLETLKVKYNFLINSDVVFREITISVQGKKYEALLVLIDGMSSSDLINNYILKPLMVEQPIRENVQEVNPNAGVELTPPLFEARTYQGTPIQIQQKIYTNRKI